MILRKSALRHVMLAGAAFASFTAPALAQQTATPPTPTVGAQVFDPQGNPVGTIDSVDGGNAVVNTGANKAAIPFSGFAKGEKGLVMGMTKAELDAAASGAAAAAKQQFAAKLTAGTPVVDSTGAALGSIESNDGSLITLARGESKVKLPVSAFGPTPSGTGVQLGMTADALDAAAKQAGGGASSESASAQSASSAQPQN